MSDSPTPPNTPPGAPPPAGILTSNKPIPTPTQFSVRLPDGRIDLEFTTPKLLMDPCLTLSVVSGAGSLNSAGDVRGIINMSAVGIVLLQKVLADCMFLLTAVPQVDGVPRNAGGLTTPIVN